MLIKEHFPNIPSIAKDIAVKLYLLSQKPLDRNKDPANFEVKLDKSSQTLGIFVREITWARPLMGRVSLCIESRLSDFICTPHSMYYLVLDAHAYSSIGQRLEEGIRYQYRQRKVATR